MACSFSSGGDQSTGGAMWFAFSISPFLLMVVLLAVGKKFFTESWARWWQEKLGGEKTGQCAIRWPRTPARRTCRHTPPTPRRRAVPST